MPNTIPENIHDSESIARLVFHKFDFEADGSLKPRCFYPNKSRSKDKKEVVLETSVLRKNYLQPNELCECGNKIEKPTAERNFWGHACIQAADIRSLDLDISFEPSDISDAHANIISWDSRTDRKKLKLSSRDRVAALILSQRAKLIPHKEKE